MATAVFVLALAPAAAAAARAPVRIDAPRDRGDVAAYAHVHSIAAQIELRGRAAERAPLVIRARCELGPCVSYAQANRKGRWRAYLHVIRASDETRLAIRAAYADEPTLERADLAMVSLAAPVWAQRIAAPVGELAMIGDSLSVGTAAPLQRRLPGWRVTTDGRVGRALASGMAILAGTPLPPARVDLAFSLFTNDDPRNLPALEVAVRRSVEVLRPGACAIWATIVRPPVRGMSYRVVNQRLEALAAELGPALQVVPWADAVRENRHWLAQDRVHATAEGYEARAQLYADAAQRCVGAR